MFEGFLYLKNYARKSMVFKCELNQYVVDKGLTESGGLFAIDYLKVKVQVTNNPEKLSNNIIIPLTKFNDEFKQLKCSYGKQWVHGSYNTCIRVKSLGENELLIEGNLFKWLNGQNITGSTDLIRLVLDTIDKLCIIFNAVTPTSFELDNIKLGKFDIYRLDLNKAIFFDDKQKAQQYLNSIKEHGTYPRRKRELYKNGIYFGLRSTRTTLLYYHKGTEVISNKKNQIKLTPELKACADLMVRCEVRLFSQHLRDNDLQFGHCWDVELIMKTVSDYHDQLNLPEPISDLDLPCKYIRFLSVCKQGTLPQAYTASTIARYKRDLAKKYGLMI